MYIILIYSVIARQWRLPEAPSLPGAASAAVGTPADRLGHAVNAGGTGTAAEHRRRRSRHEGRSHRGPNRAGWRWGGGPRGREAPSQVPAAGRAFGWVLSQTRSAHRPVERIDPGTPHSNAPLRQQVIDG